MPFVIDNSNRTHIVYINKFRYNVNFLSINRKLYEKILDILDEYGAQITYNCIVVNNRSITLSFKKEEPFLSFLKLIKYSECPLTNSSDNSSRRFMVDFEN